MSVSHLCNTFFEQELEGFSSKSLLEWIRSHPIYLQLQFLPLLYAKPDDRILVSDLPKNPDPRLSLLDSPSRQGKIEHWGSSLAIENWANKYGFSYKSSKWEIVRYINSKIFSLTESCKLPRASLLENESEVFLWIEKTPGPKLLKTAYGTAGRGHFHVGERGLKNYLQRQFSMGLPIIGEPWVKRLFDFSTHWILGESIQYLGATAIKNEQNGVYRSTFVGDSFSSFEWALEEHRVTAKEILKKIIWLGYFGHIGIDAYVYCWEGKEYLQPIVEINARKTMSWVALQIQRHQYADRNVCFSFKPCKKGLLPQELMVNGKRIYFLRNITIKKG